MHLLTASPSLWRVRNSCLCARMLLHPLAPAIQLTQLPGRMVVGGALLLTQYSAPAIVSHGAHRRQAAAFRLRSRRESRSHGLLDRLQGAGSGSATSIGVTAITATVARVDGAKSSTAARTWHTRTRQQRKDKVPCACAPP